MPSFPKFKKNFPRPLSNFFSSFSPGDKDNPANTDLRIQDVYNHETHPPYLDKIAIISKAEQILKGVCQPDDNDIIPALLAKDAQGQQLTPEENAQLTAWTAESVHNQIVRDLVRTRPWEQPLKPDSPGYIPPSPALIKFVEDDGKKTRRPRAGN